MQFGVEEDSVEATGVRLGGLHFGASPDKGAKRAMPIPGPAGGSGSGGGGGGGGSSSGIGSGNAFATTAAEAAAAAVVRKGGTAGHANSSAANGNGSAPSSSPAKRSAGPTFWHRRKSSQGDGGGGGGGGGGDGGGGGGRASSRNMPGAAARAGAAARSQERLAAEKAFDSIDQNSGRVSTPRFEELLTLLGTPTARRKGDATESARAAGLLSAYSFSREDFVNWWALALCIHLETAYRRGLRVFSGFLGGFLGSGVVA